MQVNLMTEAQLASLLKPLDDKLEAINRKLNVIDTLNSDQAIINARQAQAILGCKSIITLKKHIDNGLKTHGEHRLGQSYKFKLLEVKNYQQRLFNQHD